MTAVRDNTALFRKGLEILCAGFSRELTKPLMDAYYLTLGNVLTDDEWRVKIRQALAEEERMPVPAWFLRDRKAEVELGLTRAGISFFESILRGECTYGPVGGKWITHGSVERSLGDMAAEAFTAAGGEAAFLNARPQDLPFVQKRFVDAYKAAVLKEARKGELSDGGAVGGRGRAALAAGGGRTPPEP